MKWLVMIIMILLILLIPMPPVIKGMGIFAQIMIAVVGGEEDDDGDSNKESE